MSQLVSKRAARAEVERLVRRFVDQPPAHPTDPRARIVEWFVRPLFRALNWNTDHQGLRPDSAEFTLLAAPAPDCLLCLPDRARPHVMRRHLLFAAQGPDVDPRALRSIYRYTYSTTNDTDRPERRVRLVVVADFRRFRLLDCIDPAPLHDPDPRAVDRRIVAGFDWTCEDYLAQFDRLWDTFERDHVRHGSLDAAVVTPERDLGGRVAPDRQLLRDLEACRLTLAERLAHRAPALTDPQLTAAAQHALDRLVLARLLHDRGLEPDPPAALAAALRLRPDDDHHLAAPELLDLLAPDRSTYTLAAMPVELLGHAHEQLLGRVLARQNATIVAVAKPEVRRAGGVYYTPRAIVDELVERTVGRALDRCARPEDVAALTILDPACGAGYFLIAAYARILAWHHRWFLAQIPEWTDSAGDLRVPPEYADLLHVATHEHGRAIRLTLRLRRAILRDNIFGVDIDEQAVEVTRLSLAMKALEDVTRPELDADRSLPDLRGNIRVGNSLIGTDLDLDLDERRAARPFAWRDEFPAIMQRGFDVVIGNPPYDVMEKDRGAASWPHDVLQGYVDGVAHGLRPALGGKKNLFRFFLVRGLELLKDGGRFGMIVPLSVLADLSTSGTRRHLLEHLREFEADCFPQKDNAARRVFRDAKLSTAVLVGVKSGAPPDDPLRVRTFPWDSFDDPPLRACDVLRADLALLDPDRMPVPLVDADIWRLCVRLHRHRGVIRLGECAEFELRRGEVNQTTYRDFITADRRRPRLLKGSEIAPYHLQPPSQGEREWFDENACLASFQRDATRDEWLALAASRRIAAQRITGVDDARRLIALIVEPRCWLADSTNSIRARSGSLEYLVALLNSDLWQWRFRVTSTNNNVQTNELEGMPFRVIDRTDRTDVELEAEIIRRVNAIQALHAGGDRRLVAAHERTINELVFTLYGVGPAERALIERTARVSGAAADDA